MQLNHALAFLIVVVGCRPGAASIPQVDAFTLTDPTVPTLPTVPTEPTEPTTPPEPFLPPLLPSATILGLPGLRLDLEVAIVPGSGDDPAVLMLTGNNANPEFVAMGVPAAYILSGRIPPGDHVVTDLWDGVSSYDVTFARQDHIVPAGDVDEDGHEDVWLWDELFLGPLLGQQVLSRHGQAWVYGDGGVVAAGFDANGDGIDDAVFAPGGQIAIVQYGPFEGMMASGYLHESSEPSWLWAARCDSDAAFFLKDQLGPGRPVLALGMDGRQECTYDTVLFDPLVPVGSIVYDDQAVGWSNSIATNVYFEDAGDVDGDGWPDVIWGPSDGSRVLRGPLAPYVPDTRNAIDPPAMWAGGQSDKSYVAHAIGDMNGDGVQELLVQYVRSWDPEREPRPFDRSWMVQFSPHATKLVPSVGVELGIVEDTDLHLGDIHGDLDGDGLSDLVGQRRYTDADIPYGDDDPGQIKIWFGKDILAAWTSIQAAQAAAEATSTSTLAP